jgi:hypothetical protein
MTAKLNIDRQNLYKTDYLEWIEKTVENLKAQYYSHIDWENLIEEIEDMGRSERKSFKSNLIVVLIHLLKWQYQPELRCGSWKGTIVEHRRRIRDALKESPSFKPYLEEVLTECYLDALEQASAETGLPLEIFPPSCLYQSSEILDSSFFPT